MVSLCFPFSLYQVFPTVLLSEEVGSQGGLAKWHAGRKAFALVGNISDCNKIKHDHKCYPAPHVMNKVSTSISKCLSLCSLIRPAVTGVEELYFVCVCVYVRARFYACVCTCALPS